MAVKVYKVSNRRDFDLFIRMPLAIYYNDPYWPPQSLDLAADSLLQIPPQNCTLLLAVKNNELIGRIAGMINPMHTEHDTALFGYFECINDSTVAAKLLQRLENWARQKEYRYLIGPTSYNTNDSIGLLIEGFNRPAQYSMPYNKSYYPQLLEQAGFGKHLDLLAYLWTAQPLPEKLTRIARKVIKTKGLVLRTLNLNNIAKEAAFLASVHNQTMLDNWGAGKLSVHDAANYLLTYRLFADPDLLLAVEINGEPAGICLTITERSFGGASSCRVAVLAVVPKFRTKGVAALLMHETANRLRHKGYREAEISLILENNRMMNRILQKTFGFEIIKRFRVYKKTLE